MDFPKECSSILTWIRNQQKTMENTLVKWADINSGSSNPEGLQDMFNQLIEAYSSLGGKRTKLALPPVPHLLSSGEIILKHSTNALLIRQRCKAPLRFLLGGHMDTVFDSDSPFQRCKRVGEKLEGPGVADMKGGLVVLLYALLALEKSPYADMIGWDVLITPDEETGSVASAPLWRQYAWQNNFGFIFEPCFTDGSVVKERKGSNTYFAIAKGKKAHAGRDFLEGRSAIAALAQWIARAHAMNSASIFVNTGYIHGGEAANIVPEKACCMLNVRASHPSELLFVERALEENAKTVREEFGVGIELYLKSRRPPKLFDDAAKGLFDKLLSCADALGMQIELKSTGGVCDGNNLAAEGLPTIDTLGVQGGGLHTHQEWMSLPSLSERACLTASLLITLAAEAPSTELFASKLKTRKDATDD